MIIRTKKKKHDFIVVDRTMIDDKRLTFSEIGTMVLLLADPDPKTIEKLIITVPGSLAKLTNLGYLETA